MVKEEEAGESEETICSAAREKAFEYAGLQRVNGNSFTLDSNAANSPDGEIVIGRLENPSDRSESMDLSGDELPNAVQVRIGCTSEKKNAVALFFAGLLGINTAGVDAQATAVFDDEHTIGFRVTDKTGECSLMPFAVSVDEWNNMMAGDGDDQWTYDSETGTLAEGSDGKREIKMFPEGGSDDGDDDEDDGKKDKKDKKDKKGIVSGNFGTVDIGSASNGAPDLWRQIREGPSADDLAEYGGELRLDGITKSFSLGGDPGMTVSMKSALADIVGQPRTIFLYSEVTGQGNNAVFKIVGFAGVRIVDFQLTGGDKYIRIQPALVTDDTAISDDNAPDTSYGIGPPVHLVR